MIRAFERLYRGWQKHLARYPDCTWLMVERADVDTIINGGVALQARVAELEAEQDVHALYSQSVAREARIAKLEGFTRALSARLGFDFSPLTPDEEAWAKQVFKEE